MVNKISRLVQKFNIITGNGSLLAVRVYLGYAIDGGYSGDREFVTMRWMDRPVSARPDELRWSVIRNVLHWVYWAQAVLSSERTAFLLESQ